MKISYTKFNKVVFGALILLSGGAVFLSKDFRESMKLNSECARLEKATDTIEQKQKQKEKCN